MQKLYECLEKKYPNANIQVLERFSVAMNEFIKNADQLKIINSKNREDSVMLNILRRGKITPDILLKHSEERNAIWRILLLKLKEFEITLLNYMKYPTIDHFKNAYQGKLCQENMIDYKEYINLWNTANWTYLLLNLMLVAKKMKKTSKKKMLQQQNSTDLIEVARANKGLVLHVIPKVVEGPDGKQFYLFQN
jgi:hypothetical protein